MRDYSPVFIIGAARSGTTLLYESLARHPALGFVTEGQNYRYLQDYQLSRYGRAKYNAFRLLKRLPEIDGEPQKASEANGLWQHYLPYWKYVTEVDVTDEARQYFRKEATKLSDDKIFLNKNPHHCYRVRYLKAVWPDARFIHIVRDPRAVVLSEYKHRNSEEWKEEPVKQFVGEDYRDGHPFWNLAKEWQLNVSRAREVQPFEITYEDLISDPSDKLEELCRFLGIDFVDGLVPEVQDMNVKFKKELSSKQITEIESALAS